MIRNRPIYTDQKFVKISQHIHEMRGPCDDNDTSNLPEICGINTDNRADWCLYKRQFTCMGKVLLYYCAT